MMVTRCDHDEPHDIESQQPYLFIQQKDTNGMPRLTKYFCAEHVPIKEVTAITMGGVKEVIMRWERAI